MRFQRSSGTGLTHAGEPDATWAEAGVRHWDGDHSGEAVAFPTGVENGDCGSATAGEPLPAARPDI